MPFDIALTDVLLAVIILFISGMVKGIIGMGLPLIASSLLLLFFAPYHVLGIIAPNVLLTNFWQAFRAGDFIKYLTRFWALIVCMMIFMLITSFYANQVNPRWIYFSLALGILLFLFSQLKKINHNQDNASMPNEKKLSALTGAFAGMIGGLTSSWSPPIAIYLHYLGLKKQAFIWAMGWSFFLGGIPLNFGYLANNILNKQTIFLAACGLIAALFGFTIGEKMRGRVNEMQFKKLVLIFLATIAINFLYKFIVI